MTKRKGYSGIILAIIFLALTTGCSSMQDDNAPLEYEPKISEMSKAKATVNEISSRILDWMAIEGKVTESGARVVPCGDADPDFSELYRIHHSWSVYDLPEESYYKAMQNVRS